jgi:methionyl-tRNA synthetase
VDLEALQREIEASRAEPAAEETPAVGAAAADAGAAGTEAGAAEPAHKDPITIDDFAKVELRVVTVEKAEPHPNADKLLVLTVRLGSETRTVVSGIRAHYAPEDLVGRKLVLVTNLQPARLRGVESQGMILAAQDDAGRLGLVTLDKDLPDGSEVR